MLLPRLWGQCKEKNKMSVYRDQLGERSNNLINELLAKGLGLAFYKGKCLGRMWGLRRSMSLIL